VFNACCAVDAIVSDTRGRGAAVAAANAALSDNSPPPRAAEEVEVTPASLHFKGKL
jgi:hypothetical protein